MTITCKDGHDSGFAVVLDSTVVFLVDSKGRDPEYVEIRSAVLPTKDDIFICTSCGEEAEVV
jgi:hypothetical protein